MYNDREIRLLKRSINKLIEENNNLITFNGSLLEDNSSMASFIRTIITINENENNLECEDLKDETPKKLIKLFH